MDGALPASGARVWFQLGDALMPELERILGEITPELEIAGEVMFLSDSGRPDGQFAIVSLGGTMSPLVVPVNRLHRLAPDPGREAPGAGHKAHKHC